MKYICFYTHFGNGDIFLSKEWIKDIQRQTKDVEYLYAFNKSSRLIQNINIKHIPINNTFNRNQIHSFDSKQNILFINTWPGAYFPILQQKKFPYIGCNYNSYAQIYNIIINIINQQFEFNIKLKDNYFEYIADVDYSSYQIEQVDDFLNKFTNKNKYLICNSRGNSNQSSTYNGNMKPIIDNLSERFDESVFFITEDFENKNKNVYYTGDFIKNIDNDLHEISYLSTKCNMILGRNSGPMCVCLTKENLFNKNKIVYSFGNWEKHNQASFGCENADWNFIEDEIVSLDDLTLKIDNIFKKYYTLYIKTLEEHDFL